MPSTIKISDKDNVAIIVQEGGVQKGDQIEENILSLDSIPQAHKIALVDIKKGDPIYRYGTVIGYADIDLQCGSWVNETNISMPKPPKLEEMSVATELNDLHTPKIDMNRTFNGYVNIDGTVGTKNLLGIMTLVQCVEGVVNQAVKILEEKLVDFPNVDGIMPINHNYGCGVAIDAPEAKIPIRTLANLATHPNFGGEILVIGLGCEKLPPSKLLPDVKTDNIIILQDQDGFQSMVDLIVQKGIEKLSILSKRTRVPRPISDLIIGVQCGGSDAFSGITANPAIGFMSDLFVQYGAKVAFSEVTEVRDGVHLLTPRCISKEVGNKLISEMKWYDEYLRDGGVDRGANTTPGNKKGGLANIVEKSLGSIAKSGTSNIQDVVSHGEKIVSSGLSFVATPASDFICGTLQLAGGITTQVFSTGRGTPYGLKMAPVVKVSSNSTLKHKWSDLIDVDAGRIATGDATIESVGQELFELVIKVASGEVITAADQYHIENALCLFNPAPAT